MDPVTNTSAASQPARPQVDDSPAATSALSSDFETFLQMLTVQMQNQDPLNPLESTDFAVQLATFSGVEQQVRTNDLLQQMAGGQSLDGLSEIAGWVGREARAPVSALIGDTPVTLYPDLPGGTDQATLTVRDEAGAAVARISIPADGTPYAWDGLDATGATVPPGRYSFAIEARKGGEALGVSTPEVYAPVAEARIEGGAPVVVFAGGEAIPPDKITGIREP